jgi:hypothetical protein
LGLTGLDDVGFCWGLRGFFGGNWHVFWGRARGFGGLGGEEEALQLEALAGVVGLAELVDFAAEGAEGTELGAVKGRGLRIEDGR